LRLTFWKSAIVPFWIEITVTWSLSALLARVALYCVGGTQPTVAARSRLRWVPGGVRAPWPPAWPDAVGWLAAWDWLAALWLGELLAPGLLPPPVLALGLLPLQAARPGTAIAVTAQAAIRPGFMVSPQIEIRGCGDLRLAAGTGTGLKRR
jgi:hypothetical protein